VATAAIDGAAQRSVLRRGLRIIATYVRMHPIPFAIAVAGATLYAAMTVGATVVLGRVTDSVLVPAFHEGVGASAVTAGIAAILGVAALRALGIVTRRYFAGMTHHRVARSLRTRVVEKYAALPLSYHQSHPTGELLAHTQADVEAATEVLSAVPYSTAVVTLVLFAVVTMILTDPFLAAIGCVTLPGLALINRFYTSRVEAPQTRTQQRIGDVSAVAHESIDGALVVKTLGREGAEVARFADMVDRLRRERVATGLLRAGFEPALGALPDLFMILLLAVGGWRVSAGAITTGNLVQFLSLFQLLAFPMRVVGYVLSDVPRAVVGYERLREVFSEPLPAPRQSPRRAPLPHGPLSVRLNHVEFGYSEKSSVLDDVDTVVAPGHVVALVGPTGSGKSTLCELMVRLADPRQGAIELGGVDLRDIADAELRAAAAIVFQESFLFATTVRENITLGAALSEAEIVAAASTAQAHDFISAMPQGYDTVLGERGVTVSGGQRQRIALARALVRDPRLLILDDATSAVDPSVEAAILGGLRTSGDRAMVVVAHRVATIALADSVLLLEEGRITASGSHTELLDNPTYAAMMSGFERSAA
jgi:ABC-type multidrug transport system fused ATPase/permease subunit